MLGLTISLQVLSLEKKKMLLSPHQCNYFDQRNQRNRDKGVKACLFDHTLRLKDVKRIFKIR